MPPKASDRIEKEVRAVAKLPGNKVCVDCPEKLPQYVNLTHNTFVCTKCSGIHREFQFKIKGISMSNFTEDELRELKRGGNEKCNAKALARYNARDYPPPNPSDISALREFIKLKYLDRRWYGDGRRASDAPAESKQEPVSRSGTAGTTSLPPVQQLSSVIPGVEKIEVSQAVPRKSSASKDLLDLMSDPIPAPVVGFGAHGAQNGFNQPSPNSFGNFPGPAGQQSFGFGAPAPVGGSFDAFGQSAPTGYGQPSHSAFGQPNPAAFGQPGPSPFGQPSSSSFGNPVPATFANGFGVSAIGPVDPFGRSAPQNAFGAANTGWSTQPPLPVPPGPVPFGAAQPQLQPPPVAGDKFSAFDQLPATSPVAGMGGPVPSAAGYQQLPQLSPGMNVIYYDPSRDIQVPAQVVKVHFDAGDPPYVTLRFSNGQERQTAIDRIRVQGPSAPAGTAPAPTAPRPDPFGALGTAAWGGVGVSAPTAAAVGYGTQSQPVTNPFDMGDKPPASQNPFDMF